MIIARPAVPGDEESIQQLLDQLGYVVALSQIVGRLPQRSESCRDAVLVADDAGMAEGWVAAWWKRVRTWRGSPVAK